MDNDLVRESARETERPPSSMPALARTPPAPARAVTAMGLGFASARHRLTSRASMLTLGLGAALAVSGAAIERASGTYGAVDRSLAQTFRWLLPFVVLGLTTQATARTSLADAVWPLARHGLAKRDVALGVVLASIVASAIAGVALATLAVLFAHAPSAPPLASDLFTSAWIGALTGAAHAAWCGLGATLGRRGQGRLLPIALHVLFGTSGGIAGALLPHGNASNLLGFAAPLGLPPTVSAAMLVITTALVAAMASLRTGG